MHQHAATYQQPPGQDAFCHALQYLLLVVLYIRDKAMLLQSSVSLLLHPLAPPPQLSDLSQSEFACRLLDLASTLQPLPIRTGP